MILSQKIISHCEKQLLSRIIRQPVELIYGDKTFFTRAYVDSGATYSMFNSEIADYLGLEYMNGKKLYPLGIGGHICAYLNDLTLKVKDVEFSCGILFSDEFIVKFNLLGRNGFFSQFMVCFDDDKRILSLFPK